MWRSASKGYDDAPYRPGDGPSNLAFDVFDGAKFTPFLLAFLARRGTSPGAGDGLRPVSASTFVAPLLTFFDPTGL
jgi:hypothetical protein